MPLFFEEKKNSWGSFAVWQIKESEEFFFSNINLSSSDRERIMAEKLPKRRMEKLACRILLSHLCNEKSISVYYSENRKPMMDGYKISFSHSGEFAAVAISSSPIGIDIEKISPRFFHLYPRFMHKDEIAVANTKNPEDLALYWCAKEAMFKIYDYKFLDLRNDLRVISENEGKIIINNSESHSVKFAKYVIDNYMVVVSIPLEECLQNVIL